MSAPAPPTKASTVLVLIKLASRQWGCGQGRLKRLKSSRFPLVPRAAASGCICGPMQRRPAPREQPLQTRQSIQTEPPSTEYCDGPGLADFKRIRQNAATDLESRGTGEWAPRRAHCLGNGHSSTTVGRDRKGVTGRLPGGANQDAAHSEAIAGCKKRRRHRKPLFFNG